ncbi:MAG: hypothetical protein HY096_09830 [Nitrospinae bacterium]|nr:hypothetical protein [Nitrospinota bacterium]
MYIGKGVLNWDRKERISDRYGTVFLFFDEWCDKYCRFLDKSINNQHGKLTAKVIKTRKSMHIGDLVRGFFPSTPKVGQKFTLGEGKVFFVGDAVGLVPDDVRDSDWLNPKVLYKLHHQTVELYFEKKEG